MKKKLSIAASCLLAVSVALAGCSGNNGNSGESAGASAPASGAASNGSSEPVTIRIFAQQGTDQDLATNTFTKLVEEKLNVKFEWTTVPQDGAAEKRQISLASGDYPDMYLLIPWVDQFSQTDLVRYSSQGVIVPLNDLIDKYAPNIKAVLDSTPYYKAMNTAPDGNIYGLTQLSECYHCSYPNKMWLNTKWLEQLNLKMPTTTDEFRDVLRAFKTQDPNGNGAADEVPLSGSTETFGVHVIPFLMNGFIYNDDRTYLTLNDGKVDLAANKPEWKEGLAYIKSMYDEGLIDPGAFTQTAEAYQKIGENADAQLLGAGAGMHPAIFVNTAEGNRYGNDYNPIAPLTGPHGSYASFNYPISAGASFVLTNKASEETRIAAIKVMDYIFTDEGMKLGTYGPENLGWRLPAEGEIALDDSVEPSFATIPLKDGEQPRNDAWGSMGQFNDSKAFRGAQVSAADIYSPSGYERRLFQATQLYDGKQPAEVFPHWAVWIDPSVADEASMMQTNIRNYIDQNALQFITGNKSLDKDWDAYVKGFDGLNLQGYLDIMQQSVDVSTINQ
ncbi:ABC transporter substrate-binding protein [Cohnella cellulosilytica]|uniref:ABC transporter substrate-binding protein n=1 Tax=Cohnella cellulosilytica TaxID=986710 RepID=A0ABW2FFT9_9BACL